MKKISEQSEIEKLKDEVERLKKELKKRKKYGLVWEEKPEEVVEMCKEKLPVLKEVKDKEIITDKNKPVDLLIEGDNYHALSVLNYTHAGKVDVIYIDPPYNTGAKNWRYNNHYVDKEDAFRHSKWLSFMNKRLKLARTLLKETGIICVTIDENEQAQLKLLLDEIFGENNYLGTVCIRNNPSGRTRKSEISLQHEYALFYSKNKNKKGIDTLYIPPEDKTHNYKQDKDGSWYEKRNLRRGRKREEKPQRFFPIYVSPKNFEISITKKPGFVEVLPIDEFGHELTWDRDKEKIEDLYRKKEVWAEKTKNGYQIFFKFRPNLEIGETPKSLWLDPKYSSREYGIRILKEIFGESPFEYPKSLYAVMDCIKAMNSSKNILVLDFFAGSGTTGHAVLELNKEDGGNRQFILCTNNENNICTDVCYPRIKKVIEGYKNLKGEQVEGLEGNLKYFRTDFVDAEPNDRNKIKLTHQATAMLCIKEGTFEKVIDNERFKIFKNSNHYTGIIWDQTAIPEFKKAIRNIKAEFSVYVFSLTDETFDEEFVDINQKVKLSPIPEAILRVYRRIFR
jgi:adenine-specific DNA-methyltransferase